MQSIHYAFKTLLHRCSSNVIKVISIALGITMSVLLFSRVAYEQSFDTCFRENDRLMQLWMQWTVNQQKCDKQEQCVGKLAGTLYEAMPDVFEGATTIGYWMFNAPLYRGNVRFNDLKITADSLFFQTMGIDVLKGNAVQDLAQKDVIYLSERLARKIFGDENPIGQVVQYNKQIPLTVRGIYADIPENATVRPEAVVSMPSAWSRGIGYYSLQGGDSWPSYMRLKADAPDLETINRRIGQLLAERMPPCNGIELGAFIAPLRDTYRSHEYVQRMSRILFILAAAILFITALNYVLISISSLSRRAKAIGVHKCSGAEAGTVFGMFVWETVFLFAAALLLSAALLYAFRDFVEDTITAKLDSIFTTDLLWVPVTVLAVLFLISTVLPGRLFARIPVSLVFRRYTEGKQGWKRPLLFIQFAGVTFVLGLLCTVWLQYQYVMNKDTGYNPERIVMNYHEIRNWDEAEKIRTFYTPLPYVEEITSSLYYPCGGYSGQMIPDEAGNNLFSTRYDYGCENYTKVMGMTILQGRPQREKNEVLVNEEFARLMHWGDDVLGRTFSSEGGKVKVVGLLKNFQIGSFHSGPLPYVLHYMPQLAYQLSIRLKEPFAENLQRLNKEAAEAFSGQTVEFKSMEKLMAENYNSVRVFRNATLVATVCILFITLMGLIGYINDEMQRRSKEIAIRKVNGAEASHILEMFSRDISRISLPAVILGAVAAWYVGKLWMEQFAVQVDYLTAYYLLSALMIWGLIIACVVVQAWKIANENPVLSLKSE